MVKVIYVKYRFFETIGGMILSKYVTKKYTSECYKVYYNMQYKIAKLDKCAILLFLFLSEKMDKSNNIVHVKSIRTEFINHSKKNLGIDYKDDTVKKAFAQLVKNDLLIQYDTKIDYTVNPIHVFKESEEKRKSILQSLIKTFNGITKTKSNYKRALGLK